MSISQNVAKNTAFQIFGRGGVILTTIVSTALLTRLLGPSGYGNYVFIFSLVMFFVTISDWGTNLIFVREASRSEKDQNLYFGNSVSFRIVWSIISLLLFIICANTIPLLKSIGWPIIVASPLLVLLSLKTSSQVIFQTKLRFEFIAVFDILISLLFLIILLVFNNLLNIRVDLPIIIVFYIFANFIGVLVSFYTAKKLSDFKLSLNLVLLKRVLFEALPTGALLLVFSVYNRIDIIILQAIKGPQPVGIYGLAYKVYDNLVLGAAYLAGALFPIISSLIAEKENEKLRIIYKKTFDILFLGGLLIMIVTIPFASVIIKIIGGNEFLSSATPLRILAFANLIAYFNHLTGYTLIALGKQKVSLSIAIIALFWNIILNLIFIPRYSLMAAAIITVLTEGLVFLITSTYLNRKYRLAPSLSFAKTFIEIIKTKGKIY